MARLEEALDDPETKTEAMKIIRSMIDRIVLKPVEDGLKAELYGDPAEIVAACEAAEGCWRNCRSSATGCSAWRRPRWLRRRIK